jgi:hypothetical protein
MRTVTSIFILLLLANLSCKKNVVNFTGYTATDALGNPMGSVDNSDWTFDQLWKSEEVDNMERITPADLTGTSTGSITIFPAYPNPCSDQFGIALNSSTKCVIRLALCDESLRQKWVGSQVLNPGFNNIIISPDPSEMRSLTLYRLYYVFDAEGQLMFKKGHGDVYFR